MGQNGERVDRSEHPTSPKSVHHTAAANRPISNLLILTVYGEHGSKQTLESCSPVDVLVVDTSVFMHSLAYRLNSFSFGAGEMRRKCNHSITLQ